MPPPQKGRNSTHTPRSLISRWPLTLTHPQLPHCMPSSLRPLSQPPPQSQPAPPFRHGHPQSTETSSFCAVVMMRQTKICSLPSTHFQTEFLWLLVQMLRLQLRAIVSALRMSSVVSSAHSLVRIPALLNLFHPQKTHLRHPMSLLAYLSQLCQISLSGRLLSLQVLLHTDGRCLFPLLLQIHLGWPPSTLTLTHSPHSDLFPRSLRLLLLLR